MAASVQLSAVRRQWGGPLQHMVAGVLVNSEKAMTHPT